MQVELGKNIGEMIVIKYIICGMIFFVLCGCSTTATRKDNGTLEIKGIGEAHWPDGASIKGEPMIKLPSIPVLR